LLEATPDLVLRIDEAGRVLEYKGAEERRSVEPDPQRANVKTLTDVLPAPVARSALAVVRSVLETHRLETFEYSVPSCSGIRFREARVVAASAGSAVALVRDVTEQRILAAATLAHVARVETLDAISQAFAGATLDYGAALDMAVRRTSELLGDACVIAELTKDDAALRPIAAHDRNSSVRELLGRILTGCLLPTQGLLEPVLDLGDTVLCNDVSEAQILELFGPRSDDGAHTLGAHALLAVPMRALGRTTGALLLLRHRTGRRYREEDVVFAQAIADRAAVAIHSAHLYAENLRQAEALLRVNRDLERRIAERTAELERANELLRQQTIEDPLTGLANRRHLGAVLELELRRARRQNDDLTLLLADVDFFKSYNDRYGHPEGDECLRRVSDALRSTFRRAGDLVARYGGEEFAVVLPRCDAEAARVVAERLREAVERLGIRHAGSTVCDHVTVSVGAASTRLAGATAAEALLRAADAALYVAKAQGRNRIALAGTE
jgi:diguanylate cyclase (GGDEF)-like protein